MQRACDATQHAKRVAFVARRLKPTDMLLRGLEALREVCLRKPGLLAESVDLQSNPPGLARAPEARAGVWTFLGARSAIRYVKLSAAFAPKGFNEEAQGNALGWDGRERLALKGRHRRFVDRSELVVRAFQAQNSVNSDRETWGSSLSFQRENQLWADAEKLGVDGIELLDGRFQCAPGIGPIRSAQLHPQMVPSIADRA